LAIGDRKVVKSRFCGASGKNLFFEGLTRCGVLEHLEAGFFNRTPPVLDRLASMMTTQIAASATGLVASMITTTGTTTMPLRAGTG
jgi:hypothetical protein